jgi:hypothetical protein
VGRWGGDRGPGRLSAPARELGGSQPPAQQAAGDQPTNGQGWCPGCSEVISKPMTAPIVARLSMSTILMPAHLLACGAGWPGGASCSGRGARSAPHGRPAGPAWSNTWSRPGQTLVDVEDLVALDWPGGAGPGPAMARCQDRLGSARPWAPVSAAVKGGHRPAWSASAAGVLGLGASTSMDESAIASSSMRLPQVKREGRFTETGQP